MKLLQTKNLNGTLEVPADKSISHRAIMFGAISEGTTTIHNLLRAEDCLSTLAAFRALGVPIEDDGTTITIHGVGIAGLKPAKEAIDVGNSGTTIRLMMGILAGTNFETTLFGDESLNKRPMNRVMVPLQAMNAKLSGYEKTQFPPIRIEGQPNLQPITYEMPVASAQVKSAILFAALQAKGTSIILEKEVSRNHTEEMIQQFGGQITVSGKEIQLTGPQKLIGQDVTVPGDISSAAFFLAAGALAEEGDLLLKNVGVNPTRTGIIDVLEQMHANLEQTGTDYKNQSADFRIRSSKLIATTIEGDIIPRLIDELPIIALLATQAHGTTIIKDAEELKVKEVNRIDATAEELQKLGADIQPTPDGLIINGPTSLHGGKVSSRGDHRIGMMLQVAALLTSDEIELDQPEAVAVSYPHFFDDFKKLSQK